jgi:hypothetical protein
MGVLEDLNSFNLTELVEIVRRQTGVVVKRSLSKERLVQIIEDGGLPNSSELASTNESRQTLENFITKNWEWLNSQIPCKGPNKGKCTIYPCPEARHVDCYLSALKQDI